MANKTDETRNGDAANGEVRRRASETFEVRAVGDGEGHMASGAAIRYNSPTQIGDWFIEEFRPGAFTRSLSEDDQFSLLNHNFDKVLGRRSSGTLRFSDTAEALNFENDLPNNADGNNLAVSIERGDISGVSVRFRSLKEEWDETGDIPKRTVIEADLIEVSITPIPAYADTDVALRNHLAQKGEHNFKNAARRMRMNQAQRERSSLRKAR